jgi:hypothetical protein
VIGVVALSLLFFAIVVCALGTLGMFEDDPDVETLAVVVAFVSGGAGVLLGAVRLLQGVS